MKKIQKHIFLLIILFSSLFLSSQTSAFLSDDLGDDLYKTLDKSMSDLESKMWTKQITANGTKKPYEVLNSYADTNCFSEKTVIKENASISDLLSYIKPECKNKDGSIDNIKFVGAKQKLENFISSQKKISEEKTKNIYEISRIGLYSDGSTKNSPFDVIFDLQSIDKIIFGEDLEYNGEELDFLDKYKKNPITPTKNKVDTGDTKKDDTKKDTNKNETTNNDTELSDDLNNYVQNSLDGNNYLCTNFSDDSGLYKSELSKLFDISYRNYNPIFKLPDTNKLDTPSHNYSNNSGLYNYAQINKTGYKQVNDNSVWPCNDFFCINIDFTFYTQELLGYGPVKSIKAILEISNGHLRKSANTSLQQKKQTTNNFELGLFKIDLSSIFHMGIQIDSKPVPFLTLENKIESKPKQDTMSELESQLNFYYKNSGLNFNRVNDISIYKKELEDKINITNNAELTNINVSKKIQELQVIKEKNIETKKNFEESIDKKIESDLLQVFNTQFQELEIFTNSILEYVQKNSGIIKNMKAIPIRKD